jgi:tRNA (guanine-N7-)-methyltransferase
MSPLFIPSDYFRELRKEEIFPDPTRPLEVELGSGDGTFLVEMAREFPDRDFLGIERMLGRVEKTVRKINRTGVKNARILRLESAYSTAWLLPTNSVSRLHLLCPDPWPKKRHHKNRLVNSDEFIGGLERILEPNGEFLLKTDHEEYFENAVSRMALQRGFARLPWEDDAFYYPRTDFEAHWLSKGLNIHRARWQSLRRHLDLKAA